MPMIWFWWLKVRRSLSRNWGDGKTKEANIDTCSWAIDLSKYDDDEWRMSEGCRMKLQLPPTPSLQAESITVTVVLYGSNGYLLDRLQSVLNSAARLIFGISKFDSISRSYDIVSSVRCPSIWQYSVVRWVLPLVSRVYALPHVVIWLFRGSELKDLATGLSLSLCPTCGTCFRPKLDNWVTIYCSSRVNRKLSCSSSPEPFCGSIFNEGPYKFSILLLLLLLPRISNILQIQLCSFDGGFNCATLVLRGLLFRSPCVAGSGGSAKISYMTYHDSPSEHLAGAGLYRALGILKIIMSFMLFTPVQDLTGI